VQVETVLETMKYLPIVKKKIKKLTKITKYFMFQERVVRESGVERS